MLKIFFFNVIVFLFQHQYGGVQTEKVSDCISSGINLWIVTWGVVVMAANILVSVLGGSVFILVTLLSLTANLTGTMVGGGMSWNLVLPPGNGCTTLGGAFRGSTWISCTAPVRSCCKVYLLHFSRCCPTGWWEDTHSSEGDSWSSTWLFWRATSFLASGWMSLPWVFQDSS